ncbi:hypothetical protein KDAU_64430 [Dictyobacter aurantiacus]|uniref:Carrier domain-containing protein n=1 Tax=Dictyobacter aurantiacus TaxID=1936993 RepID=A0A401ZQQ2_9CHLR|nr:hypothetical protein KDAU_64430 [Dictyobacter aurantiacus]
MTAYIVITAEYTSKTIDLPAYLSAKLPKHMLPSAYVTLPLLPLTNNGKLDRKALPIPDTRSNSSGKPYAAPRTPTEQKLVQIWEQMLGITKVGINDNFFEIGGNSLHVVRLVAKAAKLGITITIKQIFECPTIARLVAVIDQNHVIAEQEEITGLVPAIYLQRRLLASATRHEVHTHAFLLKMHISLDSGRLARAVAALVQHHDGLRMVYASSGSRYPLAIIPPLPIEKIYTRVDTTLLTNEELDALIATQLDTIHLEPSELQTGPLFKVFHYDSGSMRSSQIIFMVHVLVADLESTQLIVNDLLDAYQQLDLADTVVFPPKVTSFRQWVERLHTYAQSDKAARELGFWVEQSERYIVPLPRDHHDKPNLAGTTVFVDRELTVEETTQILQEFSNKMSIRADAILLAAVMLVLEAWTGQRTMRFNLTTHGRVPLFDDMDISRTIGFFVATFPIVLDIGESRQIVTVARSIQSQLKQIPNQGIGWSVLHTLRHAQDADPLRSMPMPEIEFTYASEYESDPEHAQCDIIGPWTVHTYDTEYLRMGVIQIFVPVSMNRLHVQWNFSSNLYENETIEQLVEAMMDILRNFAASIDSGNYQ